MVISVASQKGGTGKSSTSISLGAGLARLYDKRVLLIDMPNEGFDSGLNAIADFWGLSYFSTDSLVFNLNSKHHHY